MTDKSIEWLHAVRAADPEKPWILYYSTGCAHAPHHVAKEWADKYKGTFDQGWDAYREQALERQKKLGVIPQDAELTERPDLFACLGLARRRPRRSSTPARWRSIAGFMATPTGTSAACSTRSRRSARPRQHADHLHLGRQRRQHRGDDSLARSTRRRSSTASSSTPRSMLSSDREVRRHRRLGQLPHRTALSRPPGPGPATRRSSGASRWRATSAAPATRWSSPGPTRIKSGGDLRTQFTHCIDIGPTILEAGRDPRAEDRRRDRAGADGRHQLPVHVRRRRTPRSGTPCSTSR